MSLTDLYPHLNVAAAAPEQERSAFVARVYKHVLGAIAGFVVAQMLLFATGIAGAMFNFFFSSGIAWIALLGGVAVGNWFVASAAADISSTQRQYGALAGAVGLQAIIFAPMLYLAISVLQAGSLVWAAAGITAVSTALLSVIAMKTSRDLSKLRPLVMWGFGIALVGIIASVIFGFQLGIWFSVAMIALAGASILWQTQEVLYRYPIGAHVGAAVAIFGSIMTMFWYVLRLVIQLARR